jgi:hypothetical protein
MAWVKDFDHSLWELEDRPTTRMVNLHGLEIKLIKMKSRKVGIAEVLDDSLMLDGRQPPGMGDTQADERY